MLYFAYGPNMCTDVLAERGVRAVKVATGNVPDMRLVFHKPAGDGSGKADLQDLRGSRVEGVVYDVPEESLARLDVYADVDKGHYRRQLVTVHTPRGALACTAYRAAKFKSGLKPRAEYLGTILRGAEEHRLSPDYLTLLRSFACFNPHHEG